jgi:hypothetical protein
MNRFRRAFALASAGLIALAVSAVPGGAGAQEPPGEVVAAGLDNPRHLVFGPKGRIYVAEAGEGGSGPCVEHPELGEFCFGYTGALSKVGSDGSVQRVVTGLPSIQNEDGETLGPSDLALTGKRKFVLSIGLGGSDEFRAGFGDDGALLATLVSGRLNRDEVSLLADVMANEVANNPDETDIDSNPVGILRKGNGYVIADAGGNAVVRVRGRGTFSTVAALPQGSALAPPFLGLPPGTQIPTDAVPTSVVRGPDGAFYVSQLTGFPFEKGDANIWRVVEGEEPEVYASGLTNLTDLAFARDGSLYAVQISTNGLLTGPIGSLVKITPGASQHEVVADGLFAPYGLALKKRSAYVTTCAVCENDGAIVRIPLD